MFRIPGASQRCQTLPDGKVIFTKVIRNPASSQPDARSPTAEVHAAKSVCGSRNCRFGMAERRIEMCGSLPRSPFLDSATPRPRR